MQLFSRYLIVILMATSSLFAQDRPNIILITADDMGTNDLGSYGRDIHTPALDRLADDGMRFTQFYITTSSCSPSRCSFWTGKYPHATGAENLHDPLPEGNITIAGYLKDKGYYTGNIGKLHLGERPNVTVQFDRIIERVFTGGQASTEPNGIDAFLDERSKDKPFFVGIGFSEPHRGYKQRSPIPAPHKPDKVWVPPYLADDPEVRADIADYYDEINFMDTAIGRLLKRLEDEGLEDNTLVIFFSDNGMPFPRAKTTLYESGVRVPCIIKWPGNIKAGSVTDALASSVDIAPTILDMLGIDVPADVQGSSMLPVLKDANADGREYVFVERNWHNYDDHARAVRWKNFKYHYNFFPGEPYYMASDLLNSPSSLAMMRLLDEGKLTPQQTILYHSIRPVEALYDLDNDPHEFVNLAHRAEYQETLKHLRSVLSRWMADSGDTDPEERNYHNIINRTGERLYPSRGLRRVPMDFDALKKLQAEEEERLQKQ
jgi:N-sulfoglucosamine sulfohydrolase